MFMIYKTEIIYNKYYLSKVYIFILIFCRKKLIFYIKKKYIKNEYLNDF